jgi:hypothetical protein
MDDININTKKMKNKVILTCTALLFAGFIQAQIGVNTANPVSTFDIAAKKATGTSQLPEGLLVPRVDRERAGSMNSIATSTLIFVNSVATGTQTGNAVNIDTVGYYYFDGNNWVKLNAGTIVDEDTNIYNTDGTLTGNRILTQNANTLALTGSVMNAFSVDGNTFSVDAANNRVGIGTTNPQTTFHTKGTRRFENVTAGSVQVGSVLTATDGNGTAEWKASSSRVIIGGLEGTTGIDIPFTINNTDYKYTGRYIVLPPGKWAVTITQLAYTTGTLTGADWMFVRSTFTDSNVPVGGIAARSADTDTGGGPVFMSFRVTGPTDGNPQQFDVFQGTIFINNTSGGDKTYKYIAGNTAVGGGSNLNAAISKFGGLWGESSIYATAVQ